MNRLAAIVIPPAMGVIADHWGAGQSFVILGAILIVLCAPVNVADTSADPGAGADQRGGGVAAPCRDGSA